MVLLLHAYGAHSKDPIQWCFKFVRNICDESCLALVGGFGRLFAYLELLSPFLDPLLKSLVLHHKLLRHLIKCPREIRELIVHKVLPILYLARDAKGLSRLSSSRVGLFLIASVSPSRNPSQKSFFSGFGIHRLRHSLFFTRI